jgi:flagellar biosynthesis GTPase FlhF
LSARLGRSETTFDLWQDKEAIAPGQQWESEIRTAVEQSVFFIFIVTPRAVNSHYCKFKVEAFLAREQALGRTDLVFPILYIGVPELEDEAQWRKNFVLLIIRARQYFDWRPFRHLDVHTTAVREAIERFCNKIVEALRKQWVSPEERRKQLEIEAARQAEEKRQAEEQRQAEAARRAEEEKRLAEVARQAEEGKQRAKCQAGEDKQEAQTEWRAENDMERTEELMACLTMAKKYLGCMQTLYATLVGREEFPRSRSFWSELRPFDLHCLQILSHYYDMEHPATINWHVYDSGEKRPLDSLIKDMEEKVGTLSVAATIQQEMERQRVT